MEVRPGAESGAANPAKDPADPGRLTGLLRGHLWVLRRLSGFFSAAQAHQLLIAGVRAGA